MTNQYDAIIVGGGPSGATSAVLLAQAGWRIAVVEKAEFPRRKVCGEFISETTWPLLKQLGVAGPLLKLAGPRVRRVAVYAGTTMVTAALASSGGRAQAGGRAVGREHLDALLLQRAAAAGAAVWQPCALAQFVEHESGYECTIIDKGTRRLRVLRSRLVVAAHGSCIERTHEAEPEGFKKTKSFLAFGSKHPSADGNDHSHNRNNNNRNDCQSTDQCACAT